MKKILLTHPIPESCIEPYREEFDITIPVKKLSQEEILRIVSDYEALFLIGSQCDKEILEAGGRLKAVANLGVGYDNIDWEYATGKGIAVVNTPTQVTEVTAEHCIALIMAVMRGTCYYDRFVRKGFWDVATFTDQCTMIAGSTLGIVGFGRIGRLVCKKAQGLGMRVIYHDIYRMTGEMEREYRVEYKEMDELLAICDCISLNMPYTPENRHFINRDSFRKMKKDSYLVNCARGPVVDEQALAEALDSGCIKGAGLDVFEDEPHILPELLRADNVVLTPHIASAVLDARIGMAREALDGIAKVLKGEETHNVINPEVLTWERQVETWKL